MIASDLWTGYYIDRLPDTATKWQMIKHHAINLLTQCDWTQLPDSGLTLSQQVEWMEYRQTLKELDTTYTNPDDVVFPDAPIGERP